MTRYVRQNLPLECEWMDRHFCRSAVPFRSEIGRSTSDRRNVPHLVAEAFVRSIIAELGLDPRLAVGLSDPVEIGVYDPDDIQTRLRPSLEVSHGPMTTLEYCLTQFGLPVWGSSVSVTLLGAAPSLLEATVRLPSVLPELPRAAPQGAWLPHNIDSTSLLELLGIKGPLEIASKRLVIHRVEPEALGPSGRLVSALNTGPDAQIHVRSPLRRITRKGAFGLVSEIGFEWAPPGMSNGSWRILIDPMTGALTHAERRVRDVLGTDLRHQSEDWRADRRPVAPAGARFPELADPEEPATYGWASYLRAAAQRATDMALGSRGRGRAA